MGSNTVHKESGVKGLSFGQTNEGSARSLAFCYNQLLYTPEKKQRRVILRCAFQAASQFGFSCPWLSCSGLSLLGLVCYHTRSHCCLYCLEEPRAKQWFRDHWRAVNKKNSVLWMHMTWCGLEQIMACNVELGLLFEYDDCFFWHLCPQRALSQSLSPLNKLKWSKTPVCRG